MSSTTVIDPARVSARTARGAQLTRRTVGVLFVDIVGFTALIDDLDCEVVRALQDDYFATVAEVVRAYGGVLEKYVGDAVMAVFGARGARPQPDDEIARDTARAVAAGLAAQRALQGRLLAGRFRVRTRAGVSAGEAIVDRSQARDGGQALVSGRVVNTASRLQAYAPHDTVVVCAAARAFTADLVAYQDLPPVVVAGLSYPVPLWRALHPQPRNQRG